MTNNPNLPSTVSTIVLGVGDIDASVAFYRDVLELELKGQQGTLAFLSLGDVMLMLNGELAKLFTRVAGAVEIVMPVDSVTAAHALLTERGCRFLNEPRQLTPEAWGTTFADPDGHMLTLMGAQ